MKLDNDDTYPKSKQENLNDNSRPRPRHILKQSPPTRGLNAYERKAGTLMNRARYRKGPTRIEVFVWCCLLIGASGLVWWLAGVALEWW